MASKIEQIKEHYRTNLKAEEYALYMKKTYDDAPEIIRFVMTFVYNVLKSGKFAGSSVLDIASGALVHSIASASAFYTNIVMSDYVEDNCNELKNWLKGKSSIKQFLDVPAELEGYGSDLETGKKIIEERIKTRVKNVVRCDVLLDGILMEELPLHSAPPYDLIICCFCLEAAAPDAESYIQIYKRISALLRPGGGLLACGCFEGKEWYVNKVEYNHLVMNQNDLTNALKEAGFGEIDIKTQEKLPTEYVYDKVFCVVATKMK